MTERAQKLALELVRRRHAASGAGLLANGHSRRYLELVDRAVEGDREELVDLVRTLAFIGASTLHGVAVQEGVPMHKALKVTEATLAAMREDGGEP
jgi:hypothetical protein